MAFSFVLAATAACGGGKPEAKAPSSEGSGESSGEVGVGLPAPDLSIQTINGKGKITNDSLKGRIVVVDFWATWCGPCKTSFPKLEELSKKHAGRVDIVGVSVDDEKTGVADFAKENGATFAIAWDEGHSIANRWNVQSMPTTYILDATGKIRYVHAGFHDDEPEKISKELTALLDEPAPSNDGKETKVASAASAASEPEPAAPSEEAASEEPEAAPPPAPTPKKGGKGKGKGGGKKSGKKGGKPKKKH